MKKPKNQNMQLNSHQRNSISNQDVPIFSNILAKWSEKTIEDRLMTKNAYRELYKPKYARFKLKIQYKNNLANPNVMFSLDWTKKHCKDDGINPISPEHSPDNEQIGLCGLIFHCLKQFSLDNIMSAKIYCNTTEQKESWKMNYNIQIFNWIESNGVKGFDLDNCIKELKFNPLTNKVDLEELNKYVHLKINLRG